jgi:prepilin-type N-terminal cleavage/methylation domain-containing protein
MKVNKIFNHSTAIRKFGALRARESKGFSLLEILVALSLGVLFVSIVIPMIGGYTGQAIEDSATKLASVIRKAHDGAISRGQIVRVMFQLDEPQHYEVQSTQSNALLMKEVDLDRMGIQEREAYEAKIEQRNSKFTADTLILRNPEELPAGVSFEWVKSNGHIIDFGKAYLTFFENGRSQELEVKLVDEAQNAYLVVVNPLTGQTEALPTSYEEEEDET